MAKYRIIKVENTNRLNATITYFKIQKRFLFRFRDYGITVHYYTYKDWNAKPIDMALLTKRYLTFSTLEAANKILSKLENPFRTVYNGNIIKRVFDDFTLTDVYINCSCYNYWDGKRGYEFSNDLDDLKYWIDERTQKVKISVV